MIQLSWYFFSFRRDKTVCCISKLWYANTCEYQEDLLVPLLEAMGWAIFIFVLLLLLLVVVVTILLLVVVLLLLLLAILCIGEWINDANIIAKRFSIIWGYFEIYLKAKGCT